MSRQGRSGQTPYPNQTRDGNHCILSVKQSIQQESGAGEKLFSLAGYPICERLCLTQYAKNYATINRTATGLVHMTSRSKIIFIIVFLGVCFYVKSTFSQENCFFDDSLWERGSTKLRDNTIWASFLDMRLLGNYVISQIFAIGLAAMIALHPKTYGKKKVLEEIEAPKTFLIYSMIGSIIGTMVGHYGGIVGFVVFGIGGLIRFRTDAGSSAQTGRLILVTLIGLCCGLNLLQVAMVSTLVGWVLLYFLEYRDIYHLEIKGLNKEIVHESAEKYRSTLKDQKCHIILERKNFLKSQVTFIFSSDRNIDPEILDKIFMQQIPENLKGSTDWQVG